MDMGDQSRFWQQKTPLDYPPTALRVKNVNDAYKFWMSRPGWADSQEDVEVDAPSPDLRNSESAAAHPRARKETTSELELKIPQLQKESLRLRLIMEDLLLTICETKAVSPPLRNMESAVEDLLLTICETEALSPDLRNRESAVEDLLLTICETEALSPDLRNRESAAARSHAKKETYINELELKVSRLEEENSKLNEAKTYINELELKVSRLEEENSKLKEAKTYINGLELKVSRLGEENSKLKEAKANQFTAAFASLKKDGKKTETKIGLGLNLEDLEPHFGKRLEDVAEELDVGRSTIKRVCRDYGIDRWPCNKKNKSNPTNGISCRDSKQNVPPSAASSKNVTMKVGFEDDTIKFDFCLSSGMEKLLSEVGRRLNLKVGGFKLKYLDEDGDDILLACDDDLQFYLKSLANVVEKTCIKLFVHL